MEYKGKLFGNVGGTYFPTGWTSEDWDRLESEAAKVKGLESIIRTLSFELKEKNDRIRELCSHDDVEREECSSCCGTGEGQTPDSTCSFCHGSGIGKAFVCTECGAEVSK